MEALLSLMANVHDSNIIRRAGLDVQKLVMRQAQKLLDEGWNIQDLENLNGEFVRMGISPGGSADLLAVSYFLYFYRHPEMFPVTFH